jgi:beta-lactamase regulating signal transducer with metallopeptidase domain
MPADPFADAPAPNATGGTTVSGNPPNIMEDYQTAENFLIIGQCLWAWILGWLGGLFAQFLALRQVRTIERQKVSSSAASPLKSV